MNFHETLCTSFAADLRRCLGVSRDDIYSSKYRQQPSVRIRLAAPCYQRAHDILTRNGFRVTTKEKCGCALREFEVLQFGKPIKE